MLEQGPPPGESFDIDMMLWFNGWVTLFNAVHICLGDIYKDGFDTIMARQRKDPLSQALHRFDRPLLDLYAEVRDDLAEKISQARFGLELWRVFLIAALLLAIIEMFVSKSSKSVVYICKMLF